MASTATIPVVISQDLGSEKFDSLILVTDCISEVPSKLSLISECLKQLLKVTGDNSKATFTLNCESMPYNRLIVSMTGNLDRDYDDVRRITEASLKGLQQAFKIDSVRPLLALGYFKSADKLSSPWSKPSAICLAALLGALHALYVPLEIREAALGTKITRAKPLKAQKVEHLGWFSSTYPDIDHVKLTNLAWCTEEGRRVARDIGGSDPERMCASNIVDYLYKELTSPITVKVSPVDASLYPLAAAVDRGSNDRHRGSIVHIDYESPPDECLDPENQLNLFLVGKGITYDTGGLDIKFGGSMASMHRDKCGAAAVAGFFKTLGLLKPQNIKVHGSLALIRNSIGENAYASDEIITTRAGVRVRVTNTDAEGRLVLADLLWEAKEKALHVPNPRIVTIATLTRHVGLSYGPNYTAAICNGPARQSNEDKNYQAAGALLGEMFEISMLRREDYEAHKALDEYADIINSARFMGIQWSRGHQSPTAFMIMASGLDLHSSDSDKPLSYTHLDIASSQGPYPGIPTGVPVATLVSRYLIKSELD